MVFLLLLFNFLFAENMEVFLKTKNPLFPIYLSDIYLENTQKDRNYLKETLAFDLENSGYCSLIFEDEVLKGKVKNFDFDFWKAEPIRLVIKLIATDKSLKIYIFDKKSFSLFKEIPLVEDIKKNRKKIHEISDAILKTFFHKKGICRTKILFAKKTGTISEIWQADWDGYNAKRLTFENNYAVHPIKIEKKEFLYVSYKTGLPKIYHYKDHKIIPFICLRGMQMLPSINSNFSALTFISDVSGREDLFYQKIKNKRPLDKPKQIFTCKKATQAGSSFSLNRIAFVSDKEGPPKIYFLQDSNISSLKTNTRESVCPAFSKDSTKLAYSAKTEGIRQIWVYDFILDIHYQLTQGPLNKENPCWAEDNFHIIYNTEGWESQLYLIDLNRKKPVKITKDKSRNRFAFWGFK